MANDKATIDRIAQLKGAAESAGRELAKHEAASEQAQARVGEIEAVLTDAGFDPDGDLTAQLADASAEVEREMGEIGMALEGLR